MIVRTWAGAATLTPTAASLGAIPPSPRAIRSVIISHIAPDIDRIRPFTPLHQRNPGSIRNVTQEASFFS